MRRLTFLFCLCGTLAAGCAVRELHYDQDKIRCALLDLYTNQIVDNLIRASNGLPIIQLDYTNATAQVTVMESETLNDSLATTSSTVVTTGTSPTVSTAPTNSTTNTTTGSGSNAFSSVVLASLALMNSVAQVFSTVTTKSCLNTLMGGGTVSNSNQVALSATPVTTANEVYDAYLEFLTLPGSLQASKGPPPSGAAHICKKCGKLYYWVPTEFKREFLRLSLITTAQRGKTLLAPDQFYSVTLVQDGIIESQTLARGIQLITARIDKEIPNEAGRIEFSDGKSAVVNEYIQPGKPRQADTKIIQFRLNPETAPLGMKTVAQLEGKLPLPVKIYLETHRPPSPTTTDLLNRIDFQLQRIQFNQMRTGGP